MNNDGIRIQPEQQQHENDNRDGQFEDVTSFTHMILQLRLLSRQVEPRRPSTWN